LFLQALSHKTRELIFSLLLFHHVQKLHNIIEKERRQRKVEILKFRGTEHDTDEAALLVGKKGIEVYPRPHPEMARKRQEIEQRK